MKHLRTKLLLNSLFILILLSFIGGVTIYNNSKANDTVDQMIAHDMQLLISGENLNYNIAERIAAARGYILYGTIDYKYQYIGYSADSLNLEEEVLSLTQDEAIAQLIEESREWSNIIEEEVFPAMDNGETEEALALLQNKAEPIAANLIEGFTQMSERHESEITSLSEQLVQNNRSIERTILIILIASIIIGLTTTSIASRVIVNPIKRVVLKMEQIAQGDLSGDLLKTKSKDEIGSLVHSTNELLQSLRKLVSSMNESSEQIAASAEELTASAEQTTNATEQIAASSEQMAASAETQLSSVNESVATINQISAGIQQIAENGESVANLANHASQTSHNGVETVNEVVEQMNSIESTVKEAASVIELLGERSKEIGNIVTIITDISDQTSLLALNAAIEAARAGEAGRGFAVVADEVRKLAEQTAQSATQITELIRSIQDETAAAVQSMEEGTEKTADGLIKTNQLNHAFQSIEKAIQDVESKVQEVSAAAEQIAAGSKQMVNDINVVKDAAETNSQASQENAAASEEQLAMMEEITSSAQSLTKLADEMSDVVKAYRLESSKKQSS